jgi:N-acetyl-anhydromuramyl-L-alanine amidase AmpD
VGDVDNSGTLDIYDVLHILRFLIGMPSVIEEGNFAWDAAVRILNEDTVAINSALQILRWMVGLPAEYLEEHWGVKNTSECQGDCEICEECTKPFEFDPTPRIIGDRDIEWVDIPSSNFTDKRGPANPQEGQPATHVPDMIVLHTTAGTTQSAVHWLKNPVSEISYHFIIDDDGSIMQFVDLRHWAYANGTSTNPDSRLYYKHATHPVVSSRPFNANWYTVSISFGSMPVSTPTPQQIEAVVWLIHYVRYEVYRIYGHVIPLDRDHIIGHNQIAPLTRADCPGREFPFDRIIELARSV